MRRNPQEGEHDRPSEGDRFAGSQSSPEPCLRGIVLRRAQICRVQQDVRVYQQHRSAASDEAVREFLVLQIAGEPPRLGDVDQRLSHVVRRSGGRAAGAIQCR